MNMYKLYYLGLSACRYLVPSLWGLSVLHALLSLSCLSIVIFCLSVLLQAISKKEDDVDKGGFYPTPPESIGEQSQGMVCLWT
jgi:hypothetical protein